VDLSSGAIRFLKLVEALHYVTFSALRLTLYVTGVSVVDRVVELVMSWSL
jgi:hypothetical protein